MGKLSDMDIVDNRYETFCQEYLVDLNATQAAIRAGYAVDSAGVTGARLLKNAKISARIGQLMAERSKRTGVNADRVVRELARIAFANPKEIINFDDATIRDSANDDDTAAIASVKVKKTSGKTNGIEREIRMNDKNKALELLGRHLGMFNDKLTLGADEETKQALKSLQSIAGQMTETEE